MTPYYKEKLEQGLKYQDFVVEKLYDIGLPIISYSSKEYQNLIGENKAGMEIKNDNNIKKYGNIYIEIAEKSNALNSQWIPSGIYRSDNTWLYLIGDYEEIFVFGKSHLRMAHKKGSFETKEISTSQGFLMPIDIARNTYAIKVISCK